LDPTPALDNLPKIGSIYLCFYVGATNGDVMPKLKALGRSE